MSAPIRLDIIGGVDAINRVLQCVNPRYPRQNLETLNRNECTYVMNGVLVAIHLIEEEQKKDA